MTSMRAIAVTAPGGADRLVVTEAARPRPGSGEVLIRVDAAGINRPDLLQREGRYPPPPGADPRLGLEVSGAVAETEGDSAGFAVGDRVTALVNGGGYAEWCVAPARQCLPVPDGWTAIEAAALPETSFTVWANVFDERARNGAALAAGETILVHGGAGGIGLTVIRLARARGARAIATAGSDGKCQRCRDDGASDAINHRNADFVEAARRLTGGRGVDVVLDIVGAPYLARNLAALAPGGRLSIIACLGGGRLDAPGIAPVDLATVMLRRLTITGSTLRSRTADDKARIADALRREIWPLLGTGAIGRPAIEAVFPFARAADAHRLMEANTHVGKIVLTPD